MSRRKCMFYLRGFCKYEDKCEFLHPEERLRIVNNTKGMTCGICMEDVSRKSNPDDRRFGIMSDCTHCFCLPCIRTWRRVKGVWHDTAKSCPQCRTVSTMVIPSRLWVEDSESKKRLVANYKAGMRNIECRYFNKGLGTCKFESLCFYKHTRADQTRGAQDS